MPSSKGEPLQGTEIVSAFADLGGTLGALGFASWLCVYLLRLHDSERQQMRKAFTDERSRVQEERAKEREAFSTERNLHLSKDSDNDAAMRESMQRSQEQLLQIVESNQRQVSDLKDIMSTHSQDLKAIMLEMKLAVSGGFEKLHERWDGTERRSGNAKSSASRRGSA
jgi:DNA-directed RNA polymerase subunit F